LKILSTCLGFVVIIALLGGLAHRQAVQMGRFAIDIYDHSAIGMSYVYQTQEEFLCVAHASPQSHAASSADIQYVLDRLDVAMERTRVAGVQVRALVAALPDATAADLSERMAQAGRAITRLVGKFTADGSRDEAEAQVAHGDHLLLIETAAAACLALALGWLVGRGLSRPPTRIVRTIARFATGELDHEVAPTLVRRRDEIGAVERAAAVFRDAMRQNAPAGEERERDRAATEAERRRAALLELERMRLLSDLSQEIPIVHRDGIILRVNAAGGRKFGTSDEPLCQPNIRMSPGSPT
jgi:HAMP domain-containing protein